MRIKNAEAVIAFRNYVAQRDHAYISINTAKDILKIARTPADALDIAGAVRQGKSLTHIANERLLARVCNLEKALADAGMPIETEITFEASDL